MHWHIEFISLYDKMCYVESNIQRLCISVMNLNNKGIQIQRWSINTIAGLALSMEFIHSNTWNDTHIHWHNGKNERKWTEQFVLLIFKMYIHPHNFLNDTFSMEDILGIFLVSLCWGARSRFGRHVHCWPCLYVLRPIGTLIYQGTSCTHIFIYKSCNCVISSFKGSLPKFLWYYMWHAQVS